MLIRMKTPLATRHCRSRPRSPLDAVRRIIAMRIICWLRKKCTEYRRRVIPTQTHDPTIGSRREDGISWSSIPFARLPNRPSLPYPPAVRPYPDRPLHDRRSHELRRRCSSQGYRVGETFGGDDDGGGEWASFYGVVAGASRYRADVSPDA